MEFVRSREDAEPVAIAMANYPVIRRRPGFRPTFQPCGINNNNIIHVKMSTCQIVGNDCYTNKQRVVVVVSARPTAPAMPEVTHRRMTLPSANQKIKTSMGLRNLLHGNCVKSVGDGCPCVAKLNVHCVNVRSVKNKAISVSNLVISRDIDIFALAETWLGSPIDGHVISILVPCGYEFHSVSRPHGTCGGSVVVLHKTGLTVKPIYMRDS